MSGILTKAFLGDIPPELRKTIYQDAFSHEPWLFAEISNGNHVVDARSDMHTGQPTTNVSSLLGTCKEVYSEAVRELLDLSEVTLTIIGGRAGGVPSSKKVLGTIEEYSLWKSMRKLDINVSMGKGSATDSSFMEGIGRVVKALDYGRNLKEVRIRLTWPSGTSVPACLETVVDELGKLRVKKPKTGQCMVSVKVNGDMEDEEMAEVEERLEKKILRYGGYHSLA